MQMVEQAFITRWNNCALKQDHILVKKYEQSQGIVH